MSPRWLPGIILASCLFIASASATESRDFPPASADRSSSAVASSWFELLYEVVKTERTSPPVAARAYGIASVALYEASAAGSRRHRSLVGQLNGLRALPAPAKHHDYHWPTVANAALAQTVRRLYPTLSPASAAAIAELENELAARYRHRVSAGVSTRSVTLGRRLASGVLAWSASDLQTLHANCQYVPARSGPSAWQPTPPAFANPLQPCWGSIRTMVLDSGDECFSKPPPRFSTAARSPFRAAALEVYLTGLSLSPEQKTIASYWSDGAGATGTPPGHWIAIVSQIARRRHLSLADAAEAYARVGIAVHDAFIACWRVKFAYDLLRPVTYINQYIDAGWSPYIGTPNFPTYTSGHSTQSGAAARVLTAMFGRMRFTDTTHRDHGLLPALAPRTFDSFDEAAEEAAVSRLYGGIHFAFDNDAGLAAGHCVGRAVVKRVKFRRFEH
jgi:PAP2 superfamily